MLCPAAESFSLAGDNLVRAAWEAQAKPLNSGWHATADDLIRIHTKGTAGGQTMALLIDFDPTAKWRIGIIELLDVYAFTFGDDAGHTIWSPLMLRLQDIFYDDTPGVDHQGRKDSILSELPEPTTSSDFVEFLYLTGPTWNWGRNGMTNAAFIQGPAREYFRKFF